MAEAMLRAVAGRVSSAPVAGFEVGYLDADGAEHRVELASAWPVLFEDCRPARPFPHYKGQKHFPGLWWSATMAGHVGYESWLERDHLMWLDWDLLVVGIAAQPFWLSWTGAAGKDVAHAPEFFAGG
jgi:hypothetical protein